MKLQRYFVAALLLFGASIADSQPFDGGCDECAVILNRHLFEDNSTTITHNRLVEKVSDHIHSSSLETMVKDRGGSIAVPGQFDLKANQKDTNSIRNTFTQDYLRKTDSEAFAFIATSIVAPEKLKIAMDAYNSCLDRCYSNKEGFHVWVKPSDGTKFELKLRCTDDDKPTFKDIPLVLDNCRFRESNSPPAPNSKIGGSATYLLEQVDPKQSSTVIVSTSRRQFAVFIAATAKPSARIEFLGWESIVTMNETPVNGEWRGEVTALPMFSVDRATSVRRLLIQRRSGSAPVWDTKVALNAEQISQVSSKPEAILAFMPTIHQALGPLNVLKCSYQDAPNAFSDIARGSESPYDYRAVVISEGEPDLVVPMANLNNNFRRYRKKRDL